MNACPACSQAVSPNDLVCPKCGISLHHGTASAGPTSAGRGPSLVLIVAIGLIAVVLLLGCLLGIASWFFLARSSASRAATVAYPAGSTVEMEFEDVEVLPLGLTPAEPSKTDPAIP
jgi:hypothetical protein